MQTEWALKHFRTFDSPQGVNELAAALGVTRVAVYNWRKTGTIPEHRREQVRRMIAERRR